MELLLTIVLIFLSAYVSGSEIALFSLSRFQLRSMKERSRSNYRKIKRLLGDPGGLLITVLVVNEVLNIAISTLITGAVSQSEALQEPLSFLNFLSLAPWVFHTFVGTLIATPILLLFCEITPKTIAARANMLIAPLTVNQIGIIYDLLRPVRSTLQFVTQLIARWTSSRTYAAEGNQTLKEADFMLMLEEGHREGAVQASEMELIKNVFEFDDTTVAQVFTPLAQVRSLSAGTTVRQALSAVRGQRFSRIPIVGKSSNDIIGILYSKDLLRAKVENIRLDNPVAEIMLDPIFVSPSLKLNALFRKFKQQKTHMAIVQKTASNALGIITMNDVLDVLFDDLFPDENDETTPVKDDHDDEDTE